MLKRIENRKEKKKKFWIGFFLVFIMVFSGAGILIGSLGGEKWEYNGFKFTKKDDFFITKINDQKIAFNYLPQTLLSINTSGNIKERLSSPMMYFTFDPEEEVQNLLYIDTIRHDFERNANFIVVNTMTKESSIYSLPVISCDNATPYVPVVYFNIANQTSIVEENNCVILNGRGAQFFELRDLMLYIKYGVIDG